MLPRHLDAKYYQNAAAGITRDFKHFLKNYCGKTAIKNSVYAYFGDADKHGLWIYDRKSRQWHTASEIIRLYEQYDTLNTSELESLEFKEPKDGIIAAHKLIEQQANKIGEETEKLRALNTKLNEFMQKLADYKRK